MDYRTIIRSKLPERKDCFSYLKKHLPNAEFVFDEENSSRKTLLKALQKANDDAILYLEDDIWLTKNFLFKTENVIKENKNTVINFFSMRKDDLTIGTRIQPASSFMMAQCVYLPKRYSKQLLRYFPDWKGQYIHKSATDIFISDFLKTRKERYLLYVPSLVDHKKIVSVIDKRRSRNRVSLTFKDGVYE